MKITSGPLIEKYVARFKVPVAEVIEWLDLYVNHPEKAGPLVEPTERERAVSIKGYMERETGNEC